MYRDILCRLRGEVRRKGREILRISIWFLLHDIALEQRWDLVKDFLT